MSLRAWVRPFAFALGGVLSDYLTTTIGLGMGFIETNPQYHPVWALLYFWGVLAFLTRAIPVRKLRTASVNAFSVASYIGTVNNILVISGLFIGTHPLI